MIAEQLEKKYLEKTSVSASLARQARQYMPGGDTHGHFYNPPYYTTINRGNGCYLYDVDDNRYIDCVNGYYVLAHGLCFPPTVAALAEQIKSGTTFGMPTRAQIDLARHLCERVPSLDELRFATSGSEATTMCIRAARAFTGKRKIMRVDGGYHGNHNIGELNSFAIGERDAQVHLPPVGTASSDLDDVILFPWNHPDALQQIISRHADETAAVIMEPMMLYGGWLLPNTGYLELVRRLTEENNILLVFDEVVTLLFSYGGLQEYFGVTPDLTAMGKDIGGGLPIGAWGGRSDIVELWNPERGEDAVMSIATFGGNPLSMVAGLSALTKAISRSFSAASFRNTSARRLTVTPGRFSGALFPARFSFQRLMSISHKANACMAEVFPELFGPMKTTGFPNSTSTSPKRLKLRIVRLASVHISINSI